MRRAVAADADALAGCFRAAYAEAAARIADLPAVAAGLDADIAAHEVWVAALDGGAIAGGIVLVHGDGFVKIANVAVDPAYRGRGLGRVLMAQAETRAVAAGVRELRLATHVDMPENVRLYTHLGWREVGREGNTVAMRKSL